MGGFLSGLLDVLGGPNQVKNIENNQFDFKKMAQDEFLRQQQRETARQSNETYGLNLGAAAAQGAPEGQTPDVGTLFPGADQARRRLLLDALVGKAKESKSALADQATQRSLYQQMLRNEGGVAVRAEGGNQARLTDKAHITNLEGQTASPRDEALMTNRLAEVAARVAAAAGGRKQEPLKPYWNTKTNQTEYLPMSDLAAAPKGLYTDVSTGRSGAGQKQSQGGLDTIINNLDSALGSYEKTQEGVGRMIPSMLSPTKAVAWDRYKSGLQSAAQIFGRKVLQDQRVSDRDREAYAKTIGQTSEVLTMLDPTEARRRLNLLKSMNQDYEQKYGGSGATGGGGTSGITSRAEADALPIGATFSLGGRTYKKSGPDSYDPVP